MTQLLYKLLLGIAALIPAACGSSSYEVTEPRPVLELTMLQDTYVIDQPVYLQLKVSQKGFTGQFQLSAILLEGDCEILSNGQELSGGGDWVSLANTTEILTIIPKQAGALRLSFEVRAGEAMTSGRSVLNLTIAASAPLLFSAAAPQSCPITQPVEIILNAQKKGYSGSISTQFDLLAGAGALQYGAVTVPSGDKFALPANGKQTLYYTAIERGVNKLQFAATDDYTTEFQTLEIIITN